MILGNIFVMFGRCLFDLYWWFPSFMFFIVRKSSSTLGSLLFGVGLFAFCVVRAH